MSNRLWVTECIREEDFDREIDGKLHGVWEEEFNGGLNGDLWGLM